MLQVPTETAGTPIAVTSVTQAAGVATVTTTAPHDLTSGDTVSMSGATPGEYNGVKTIVVLTASTFTYAVASGTTTPATGTISATPLESLELPVPRRGDEVPARRDRSHGEGPVHGGDHPAARLLGGTALGP